MSWIRDNLSILNYPFSIGLWSGVEKMPITFKVLPQERLVVITHHGTVPDDEFLSFYNSLSENRQIDKTFNALINLQNTESSARSPESLLLLARKLRERYEVNEKSRPKIAIFAPGNVSFGMARMFESFSRTVKRSFGVFRTMPAALNWLELPESLADEISKDVPLAEPSGAE